MAHKYAELSARGKPAKVALTAIMRKMVVLANALVKQDRPWMSHAEPTWVAGRPRPAGEPTTSPTNTPPARAGSNAGKPGA